MPGKSHAAAVSMTLERLNFYEKVTFVGIVFSDSVFVFDLCMRATSKRKGLQQHLFLV
jgi:hypothetical protein